MLAALRGDSPTVELLLDAGARWDIRNRWQQDALMLAVFSRSDSVVSLLLAAGANPQAQDHQSLSATDHAHRIGDPGITALFGAR